MDAHHVGYIIKKKILKKNTDTYLAYFQTQKKSFGKAPLMWHHLIVFYSEEKTFFFLFQCKKGTLFWGGLYSSFVFLQLPEPQILAYC
jgi:hypothetical protein